MIGIMNSPPRNFSLCKAWTYSLIITVSSFYCGYSMGAFNGTMDAIADTLNWATRKKCTLPCSLQLSVWEQ